MFEEPTAYSLENNDPIQQTPGSSPADPSCDHGNTLQMGAYATDIRRPTPIHSHSVMTLNL